MPESGGPTSQSGILYQNSVAALYLGRLCDPTERPPREQVREVQVESRSAVDDIAIRFGDDSRGWIQVKERVRIRSPEWKKMWPDFSQQRSDPKFTPKDRLFRWLGEPSNVQRELKELCNRAQSANSGEDWLGSLSKSLKELFGHVRGCFEEESELLALEVFKVLSVEIRSLAELGRDLAPHWIPPSHDLNMDFVFVQLTALANKGARLRQRFQRTDVLRDLKANGVTLRAGAGIDTYRETLRRRRHRRYLRLSKPFRQRRLANSALLRQAVCAHLRRSRHLSDHLFLEFFAVLHGFCRLLAPGFSGSAQAATFLTQGGDLRSVEPNLHLHGVKAAEPG